MRGSFLNSILHVTSTLQFFSRLRNCSHMGSEKGSGNETYYQPVPQIIAQGGSTPYIRGSSEESPLYANPLYKGLDAIPKGFPELPGKQLPPKVGSFQLTRVADSGWFTGSPA